MVERRMKLLAFSKPNRQLVRHRRRNRGERRGVLASHNGKESIGPRRRAANAAVASRDTEASTAWKPLQYNRKRDVFRAKVFAIIPRKNWEIAVKPAANKEFLTHFIFVILLFLLGIGSITGWLLGEGRVMAGQAPAGAPAQKSTFDSQAAHPEFPPGQGRDAVLRLCSKCHSPTIVLAHGQNREGWENTITKMVGMGATGTDEDFTDIADYLTASFPPSAIPKLFVNKATDQQLATLLGISLDDAKAITAYRDKLGGFKSIDEMKKTPNVNTKKIDAKKDNLVF